MTAVTKGKAGQAPGPDQPQPPGQRQNAVPGASPVLPSGRVRRPRWAGLVVWIGIAAVLLHTLVISMWVGPNTPVRQMVGNDTLRSYVMPVFEQSWMIFAPTPRRVAVNLEIRAEYIDPATGDPVITGWTDLVDGEDALIAGNPFPPRMSLAGRRVANTLNAAMGDLNDDQLALVAANYLTTPTTVLGNQMMDVTDSSVPSGTVGTYLTYDDAATHLATLYYSASLGDVEITYVQFRTGMRYAPTWAPGAPGSIDDAPITWFDYGWRQPTHLTDDELELFAPYLRMSGSLS